VLTRNQRFFVCQLLGKTSRQNFYASCKIR
jgi:hypothetical protein